MSSEQWPPPGTLFQSLEDLGPQWHASGTLRPSRLRSIVSFMDGPPAHSGETGAGISTLLFSNISSHHVVFSLDEGANPGDDTMAKVRKSPLFRPDGVDLVLGPSQQTLPQHRFESQLDLFLIDGPHAYPFPELEYYYVYPHLRAGALLIIDDAQIPTIGRLVSFLKEDDMFEHVAMVETTAIFRRTHAPTFPPTEDNWWIQRYNRRRYGEPNSRVRRLVRGLPPVVKSPIRRMRSLVPWG